MPDIVILVIFIVFIGVLILSLISRLGNSRTDELIERISKLEKRVNRLHDQVQGIQRPTHDVSAVQQSLPLPELKRQSDEVPVVARVIQEKENEKGIEGRTTEKEHHPAKRPSPLHIKPFQLDTEDLERYLGQRVLGWAAVALGIFAIGFFIKYAYDRGWIPPAGRVAIGELIGLGLIAAGLWQARKGNRLASQMFMGCGLVGCYLATYAAFGFYELISQPMAGVFMTLVMIGAGVLAVVFDAFALALLTVLGGLLTPLMLHSHQDQHISLFTYLALLVASVHGLRHWKSWPMLRVSVWAGAYLEFWQWHSVYYQVDSRPACLLFLALLWIVPLLQILSTGRKRQTEPEDWILFLLTPFLTYGAAFRLLDPDHHDNLGKIAFALSLVYGGLTYLVHKLQRQDRNQFLMPLSVALVFLAITIPLEFAVALGG